MKKSMFSPWLIALFYVFFIYATLGVAPTPLLFLRSHNLLRLTLGVIYTGCFIALVARMVRSGEKRWWRFAALAGILSLYPLIAGKTTSPEEQLHFFEYGLVGVFFLRALAGGRRTSWKIYLGALVLGGLAGWIDELLQGQFSNRHYDIRDVWLNLISVSLGLCIRALLPPSPSSK